MEQEPQDAPVQGNGSGKPGFFQHVNGIVAGLTGLAVALGGLTAATKGTLWGTDKEEPAAVAAPAEAAAAAATDEPAAEPDAGDPISYKGELVEGGKTLTIDWDGESWVVTEGDNEPWAYDDTLSPDEERVMAVSNGNYLRWPIAGGEVDESEDKVKWKTYARVDPVDPS